MTPWAYLVTGAGTYRKTPFSVQVLLIAPKLAQASVCQASQNKTITLLVGRYSEAPDFYYSWALFVNENITRRVTLS